MFILLIFLLILTQQASAFTPRLLEYVLTEFCPRRQTAVHVSLGQTAPGVELFIVRAARLEIDLAVLALVEHPPQRTAGRASRIGLVEKIYVADDESVGHDVVGK